MSKDERALTISTDVTEKYLLEPDNVLISYF